MFAPRFLAERYFAPRYFPPGVSSTAAIMIPEKTVTLDYLTTLPVVLTLPATTLYLTYPDSTLLNLAYEGGPEIELAPHNQLAVSLRF